MLVKAENIYMDVLRNNSERGIMSRHFNVEGSCMPEEHYMVPMGRRLDEIESLVDAGKYFTINRARQYGKTTTLQMLRLRLEKNYHVFFISLEGADRRIYADASAFCRFFCGLLYDNIVYGETQGIPDELAVTLEVMSMQEHAGLDFRALGNFIAKMCAQSDQPLVLMVDEADQAGNYEVFLDFLGMLRDKYLKRQNRPTFRSVILAGIYDIKNLKKNMQVKSTQAYNSPWNIAADFLVDMDFSPEDIMDMLKDYQQEHTQWQFDSKEIASLIYGYTSGYPYLVSRICKLLDERIAATEKWQGKNVWCEEGVVDAVKLLVKEPCTLFDDMRKKLDDYPKLRKIISDILFNGVQILFHSYNQILDIGLVFGFMKEQNEAAIVANRIFEMFFYNLFLSEQALESVTYQSSEADKQQFIGQDGLNAAIILQKFTEHFTDVYGDYDQEFLEENGRRMFLLYLKPIINGVGNYYIEAQTRNRLRTDIIIDYLGRRYVVELKIWRGAAYHEQGERQLLEYLDVYHLTEGYLLSFCFNKKKETGVKKVQFGSKTLFEAIV